MRVNRPRVDKEYATEVTAGLVDYYDRLAGHYDSDRFGNSYGHYLDAQERRLLGRWLAPIQGQKTLDLACGTGRLLEFATHGLDASENMVRLARQKHPQKDIRCGLASHLSEFRIRFDAIFCLHLFMHLPRPEIERVLHASFEQLQPGGLLVFDVASANRRRLTGFRPNGWHAGTALSYREVVTMTEANWLLRATRGVLLLPIHRLPAFARQAFRPFDDLAGMTPLKHWSSYLFFCLQRRP